MGHAPNSEQEYLAPRAKTLVGAVKYNSTAGM